MEEPRSNDFRERWTLIQGSFVDTPLDSVKEADSLVAEVMQQLAATFADERQRLEDQWDRDGEVPTEDLRGRPSTLSFVLPAITSGLVGWGARARGCRVAKPDLVRVPR